MITLSTIAVFGVPAAVGDNLALCRLRYNSGTMSKRLRIWTWDGFSGPASFC